MSTEPEPTLATRGEPQTLPLPEANSATFAAPFSTRYVVGARIAVGGMGEVVRAHDTILDRTVALKLVRGELLGRAASLRRFEDEARITAQLQHPGVPPVYDLGTLPDGRPFLAMKLIQGSTFAAQLRARSSPAAELSRHLLTFEAICQTVAYAHEQGVIHRDLKPLNVMVGAFGEVQVMDWGLAKESSQHTECAESSLPPARPDETRAGSILGTPAYMPPEQARGEAVDARADVFALGALLCEILTGEPPYVGPTEEALALAQLGELTAAQHRLHTSGAARDLVALALRCLSPTPAARPSAAEVATALVAYRVGVAERLRRAEQDRAAAVVRVAEERKRRRVLLLLALAGVLLLAVVGVAWWWIDRQATEQVALEKAASREVDQALDAAALALREQRLDAAHVALEQADARAAPDQRTRLEGLRADWRMCRTLDEILQRAWLRFDGKGQFEPARREYPLAFSDYGLSLTPEALLARPVANRLLDALEDWLAVTHDPQEKRRLLALLNATDPDAVRREVRTAHVTNSSALATLAARIKPEQLTPRLVTLFAGATTVPVPERLRLLRTAHARFPDDMPTAMRFANLLHTPRANQSALVLLEAEGAYRAALAAQPNNGTAWNNLGIVRQERNDLHGAIRAYRRAIAINPDSPYSLNNLGQALGNTAGAANLAEAITVYEKALAIYPEYATAHGNLGVALAKQEKYTAARAAFARSLALDDRDPRTHYNLGQALLNAKDYVGAEAAFRATLQRDAQHVRACRSLAIALDGQGDLAGAVVALQRATEIDPQNALSFNSLGVGQHRAGDFAAAVTAYEKAVALDAAYVAAWLNLGLAHAANANFPAALTAYDKALSLGTRTAEQTARTRFLAACAAVRGAKDRPALRKVALAHLRAGLAAEPRNLALWLTEPAFAPVRDELPKLPADERAEWERLWANVRAVKP